MWILIVLLWWPNPNLYAANPYKLGEFDYFHHKAQLKSGKKEDRFLDWKEPSINPNGGITYYTPPPLVLALLENPTPENAKAYLAWQKQKEYKIMEAQKAVQAIINGDKK